MTDLMKTEPVTIDVPAIPDNITLKEAAQEFQTLTANISKNIMIAALYYKWLREKLNFEHREFSKLVGISEVVLERFINIADEQVSPALVMSTATETASELMCCPIEEQQRYGEEQQPIPVVVPDKDGNVTDDEGKPLVQEMSLAEIEEYGPKIRTRVFGGGRIKHVRSVEEQRRFIYSQQKPKGDEGIWLVDKFFLNKHGNLIVKTRNILRPSEIRAIAEALEKRQMEL